MRLMAYQGLVSEDEKKPAGIDWSHLGVAYKDRSARGEDTRDDENGRVVARVHVVLELPSNRAAPVEARMTREND